MPITLDKRTLHQADVVVMRFQLIQTRDGVFLDQIGASDLSEMTLTHMNSATAAAINSRNGQNVLNANNVTIDEDGWVEWTMQGADNPIVSSTLKSGELEDHLSKFIITKSDGLHSTFYVRTRVMKAHSV